MANNSKFSNLTSKAIANTTQLIATTFSKLSSESSNGKNIGVHPSNNHQTVLLATLIPTFLIIAAAISIFIYVAYRRNYNSLRRRLIPMHNYELDDNDSDDWQADLLEDDREQQKQLQNRMSPDWSHQAAPPRLVFARTNSASAPGTRRSSSLQFPGQPSSPPPPPAANPHV